MNSNERKIKVLDEHIINLIAAGEVIERASSVVKELVENSIDAGSTNINVSLVDSGLKEICVSDNGCGMNEYDCKIAILPHATSKISNDSDLFSIHTLGFRGEALASIIAVSNTVIKTCDGVSKGFMMGLKGGKVSSEAYIGFPRGTEIKVKNLFFNTPARLQNLKSEVQELSYITDFVCKIALANPQVAFKLTNNDKVLFQSYGNGNLLEVINNVYDTFTAKNMITIANSNGLFKISGYISNLAVTKSNKNNMTIIVNNRIVRNYSIISSILEGYNTLLTVGRFPVCVIEIFVDYSLVDVNVHPTKSEVRFSDEEKLTSLISETIRKTLLNSNLVVNNDEQVLTQEEFNNPFDYEEEVEEESLDEESLEEDSLDEQNDTSEEIVDNYENSKIENQMTFDFKENVSKYENVYEEKKKEEVKKQEFVQQELDFVNKKVIDINDKNKISKLYYIGQLFGTYILAQNDNEFYVIDQHAANERINYEKILKELEKENVVSYEIMFPVKLTFTPNEALLVNENMDKINKLGITLDDFGGGSFIVRTIPLWINQNDINNYVETIISEIINDRRQDRMEFLDNMAKSMACKRSVKANEYLSSMQIDYLLEDLVKCTNPYTCPHGRPIIIKYSKYEIEKWFKRVQ